MSSKPPGILPIQDLTELVQARAITADIPLGDDQIQPNSIDLRVGTIAYRARYSFLPVHKTVEGQLAELTLGTLDLSEPDGAILETGKVYVIPLMERLRLPEGLSGTVNPKSSTGRLDLLCRLLTDRASMFDQVAPGYRGPLFVEVVPRAFPVRLRAGDTLSQLRLVQSSPEELSDDELRAAISEHKLIISDEGRALRPDELAIDGGVFLSVKVAGERGDETIGYSARKTTPVVDLRRYDHPKRQYWTNVPAPTRRSDHLILHPNEFYIFASRERVVIPPHLCAEMVPYDAKSGELRTHYAGFFDSGFGMGGGARVVLEVRNLDVPFLLQDSQRLFRLRYFRNSAVPDVLYGDGIASNYQGQGLRLSKHFSGRAPKPTRQLDMWKGGKKPDDDDER